MGNPKMKQISIEQACAIVAEGRDVNCLRRTSEWGMSYATTVREMMGSMYFFVDLPNEDEAVEKDEANEAVEEADQKEPPAEDAEKAEPEDPPKPQKKPPVDRQMVMQMYRAGTDKTEIAEKFGCTKQNIERIIREMNPKPQQARPAIDRGKVRALRNAGWSAKEIADEMNCSEGTIWNIFSEFKREEK